MLSKVWVFIAPDETVTPGIFSELDKAHDWISQNRLTGLLTEYPVDIGVLDWAMQHAGFNPPAEKRMNPSYIGRFVSGQLRHFHYENGNR